MAHYDDLLTAAAASIARVPGQRGRLPAAVVRRAISTAYYALFSFVSHECGVKIVGNEGRLLIRRRAFARVLTHKGAKTALGKIRGAAIDADLSPFFNVGVAPNFARQLALVFADAQAKRHEADYDLNAGLNETDAIVLIGRVRAAIAGWIAARSNADRDFKHAICLLIVFKGKLKPED